VSDPPKRIDTFENWCVGKKMCEAGLVKDWKIAQNKNGGRILPSLSQSEYEFIKLCIYCELCHAIIYSFRLQYYADEEGEEGTSAIAPSSASGKSDSALTRHCPKHM